MSNSNKNELFNIPENLVPFIDFFDLRIEDLDNSIIMLDDKISNTKDQIQNNDKELKNKIQEISSKKKQINIKLHGVSGDYDAEELLKAADTLKNLTSEEDNLKLTVSEEKEELNEKLTRFETEKEETLSIKKEIDKLMISTKEKLVEIYDSYKEKLKVIKTAIEVCDNENLKRAYEEENSHLEESLNKVSKDSQDELETILKGISKEEKNDSFDEITFEKKKEYSIKKEKQENKEEVPVKVEIDNPEPNFSEVKEEKIEDPIKEEQVINIENLNIDIPTEKEINDSNREIISKVDATAKADLVKGSEQVRKSIEKFFSEEL